MKPKPFVYVGTSLTLVPERERPGIAKLVAHLKTETHFLQWAFDPVTWMPREVKNIFLFDTSLLGYADFVAFVFWSSAGADGRGGEAVLRAMRTGNKGVVIYIAKGAKVTRFILDMAAHYNILIREFTTVDELGGMIVTDAFGAAQDDLWPVGKTRRDEDLRLLSTGEVEKILSLEAARDLQRALSESSTTLQLELV